MEQQQGCSKKLRCMETDLCVLVGEDKKEYHHHAAILAAQSTYIDTMLATPMKEREERVICFPDIDSATWESMMNFLNHPAAILQMTPDDAMAVAVAYDTYDFAAGRACCNVVLARMFDESDVNCSIKPHHDLDSLMAAYLVADAAHLDQTLDKATPYFAARLQSSGQYGRLMFTHDQITKLAPLMIKYNLVSFDSGDWTEEQVLLPTFPKIFVDLANNCALRQELEYAVTGLKCGGFLQFTRVAAGCDKFQSQITNALRFYIEKSPDGWVMYEQKTADLTGAERRLWYRCPYSASRQVLPPKKGWMKLHYSNTTEIEEEDLGDFVTIEYVYRQNEEH